MLPPLSQYYCCLYRNCRHHCRYCHDISATIVISDITADIAIATLLMLPSLRYCRNAAAAVAIAAMLLPPSLSLLPRCCRHCRCRYGHDVTPRCCRRHHCSYRYCRDAAATVAIASMLPPLLLLPLSPQCRYHYCRNVATAVAVPVAAMPPSLSL